MTRYRDVLGTDVVMVVIPLKSSLIQFGHSKMTPKTALWCTVYYSSKQAQQARKTMNITLEGEKLKEEGKLRSGKISFISIFIVKKRKLR